ncbi:hypothetical protein ACD578_15915 [Microvirga sp. RSM25]|uniref:hypothetical protein n=1 Tax=Microvirga sp. RSM25 TaxID=3273802 RepID=UPI00384A7558
MPANHLRLVTVAGHQVAPAPRRNRTRDQTLRQDREIMLCIIKEHLGHLTHSVDRIKALAVELEISLGIAMPEFEPLPRPDLSA